MHPSLFQLFEKQCPAVPKPDDLKELMAQVTLAKDDQGYFVRTHRARSKSYKSPHDIPKSKIEFVASTG